jgi:hypothetical protein
LTRCSIAPLIIEIKRSKEKGDQRNREERRKAHDVRPFDKVV